jgi:hypothetical protein
MGKGAVKKRTELSKAKKRNAQRAVSDSQAELETPSTAVITSESDPVVPDTLAATEGGIVTQKKVTSKGKVPTSARVTRSRGVSAASIFLNHILTQMLLQRRPLLSHY